MFTNQLKRPSRIPMEIKKQSQVGKKCADINCGIIHSDVKRMYSCKSAVLPVGTPVSIKKLIHEALNNEGLELTDGCSSTDGRY